MRCHYIRDKIAGKVLISGCWGTVHSNDISDCYCSNIGNKDKVQILEDRIERLEKKIKEYINPNN